VNLFYATEINDFHQPTLWVPANYSDE